ENVGPAKFAIDFISSLAVSDAWAAQYLGTNKEWGEQATEWLNSWFQINDVCGNNLSTNLKLVSTSIDRDGDILTHLTYADDGKYPMIQFIGGEQINSKESQQEVEGGPFDGYPIYDGVVVNDRGRPIAYQVGENQYISTQDALLSFEVRYTNQWRGYSSLGTSLLKWIDYRDIVDFELEGIKQRSAISFVEKNESGGLSPGQFQSQAYNFSSSF